MKLTPKDEILFMALLVCRKADMIREKPLEKFDACQVAEWNHLQDCLNRINDCGHKEYRDHVSMDEFAPPEDSDAMAEYRAIKLREEERSQSRELHYIPLVYHGSVNHQKQPYSLPQTSEKIVASCNFCDGTGHIHLTSD